MRRDTWRGRRAHVFALAALSGGTLITYCGVASGQTPPPISEDAVVEVVVTGSRIPRSEIEGAAPVTIVTAEQIKAQGYTTLFEFLNTAQQFF